MSRYERQVSWLPLVAPNADLDAQANDVHCIWQPKFIATPLSHFPVLPETPPTSQIQVESIVDERRQKIFCSPTQPQISPCKIDTLIIECRSLF